MILVSQFTQNLHKSPKIAKQALTTFNTTYLLYSLSD